MRTPLLSIVCALSITLAGDGRAQNCSNTSVGFTPLNDLGTGTHQGATGGLYPGGQNVRPLAHEVGGLVQASQVVPRDANGNPDPSGRIVVMSVGMSNTRNHWQAFMQLSDADPLRAASVTLFQGAQGGIPAEDMDDPADPYWTQVLPQKMQQAGVSAGEVQVVWFLQANRQPTGPFPQHAATLKTQMASIMRILRANFPNVRMVYCGSRIYAGYATTTLNPEPWAYESAWSVKGMIQEQIHGDPTLNYDPAAGPVVAPWISWAAYPWADGLVPRSDGLIWECSDFNGDGTHPSPQGSNKHAGLILDTFQTDTTARLWYLAEPEPVAFGVGKTTSIGTQPVIGSTGVPSLASGGFAVTLSAGVPGKAVVPFHGAHAARLPFFGGTLFAAPPLVRLPVQVLGPLGETTTPVPIGPALVGTTRVYQFWGRDKAHPDGTSVSLSNALQVLFVP